MATRSKYLGVYNVSEDKVVDGKYRVAIRKKNFIASTPDKPVYDWFNVNQQFKTETAAARVYNAYAISFFGKGAVLNDVTLTDADTAEVLAYFNHNEFRAATMERIAKKMQDIKATGHDFKMHTALGHMQTPPPV